jgi:elongator complex protein 5
LFIYIAPDGPLTVIVDAADVLCADLESPSKSYALIATLLSDVSARPSESHNSLLHTHFRASFAQSLSSSEPSRLILHFSTPSPLRDLVLTPRLSSTLAQVIAHPPALLKHLATTQLTPPPPASTPDRFWSVFVPLSARTWEVERIVLGPGGVGLSDDGEIVLQVVTRGRGRNVERDLDGWTLNGPCSLSDLDSLKGILEDRGKSPRAEVSELPTRGVRQGNDVFWIARYVVQSGPHTRATGIPCQSAAAIRPQGYCVRSSHDLLCHLTRLSEKDASHSSGAILYDPDSADDIDDDDPDEDLDI